MSDTTSQQPFQSAIQDPFAPQGVSNTSQPGFAGVSPDVWRSIAGFGANLATAANARTGGGWLQYGNGFLPLLGAAVGQSQQQGLARGNELSEMALRGAQAQGQRLQNAGLAMQLPMQQAMAQLQYRLMTDAPFRQQYMNGLGLGGGNQQPLGPSSAPPQQGQTAQGDTPAGGSSFSNGIASMESHGNANATNPLWAVSQGGPLGPHQFTGDTWLGFARENPQYFQGKSTPEILAMRTDPQLSATATEWYSAKNAIALKAQGIDPTPANLGIAHALGGAGAANLLRMPDNTPIGQIMPQIIRQNPQYAQMTVGDLKAKYAGLGAPTWMTNPPSQTTTPAQMVQAKPFQPGGTANQAGAQAAPALQRSVAAPAPQQAGAQPAPAPQQAAQNLPVPPIPPQGGQDVPVPNGNGLVRHPDGTVGTPGGGFGGGQPAPQPDQQAAAPQPAPYKEASVTPTAPPSSQGFAPPQPKAATQPPKQVADGTPPAQPAPQQQPQQSGGVNLPKAVPVQEMLRQADEAEAKANALEQQRTQQAQFGKLMPGLVPFMPVPYGDPAALRQQAQTLRQNALQAQNEAAKPQSLRGPGSVSITTNGVTSVPIEYTALGPDGREYRITQQTLEDPNAPYQRPAGVPDWTPKGTLTAVPTAMSPGEKKGQEEAAETTMGEQAIKQYQSAVGTTRAMEDLDHQFDQLNAGGQSWYNTGEGATWKLGFAKTMNSLASSAGLPPVMDESKIASGEDIVKQAKIAGMQVMSSMMGASREAASVIQSTQSAVPNIENTPQGAKLVLNGMREASQLVQDQHAFNVKWYQEHNGNMVGADVAFNQANPSQMYSRRAISMIKPYTITSDKELSRYLPGTFVNYKGNTVQVPDRDGMAPMPEYLHGAVPWGVSRQQAPQ